MQKELNPLSPKYFDIDTKDIENLVNLTRGFSELATFYDLNGKKDGNWSEFFTKDSIFLCSEIKAHYDSDFSKEYQAVQSEYHLVSEKKDKYSFILVLVELIHREFLAINSFYLRSLLSLKQKKNDLLTDKIETLIKVKLNDIFFEFTNLVDFLKEMNLSYLNIEIDFDRFQPIFRGDSLNQKKKNSEIKDPDYLFKKLQILYLSLEQSLLSFSSSLGNLFNDLLLEKSNRAPHISLYLGFYQLYKYAQKNINNLTEKHLDLFYKNYLKQKEKPPKPVNTFAAIKLFEESENVALKKNSRFLTDLSADGQELTYLNEESEILSNNQIAQLHQLFIGKNKYIDYNTASQPITNIYKKDLDVSSFEETPIFGEDQMLIPNNLQNMAECEIGFAISSKEFLLSKGNRKITMTLELNMSSTEILSTLLLEICGKEEKSIETVFNNVFFNAFNISITSTEGWLEPTDISVVPPKDWLIQPEICIEFELLAFQAGTANYDPELHEGYHFESNEPIVLFTINQDKDYNPLLFLSVIELNKIHFEISVNSLTPEFVENDEGETDISSAVEIFGPSPRAGSKVKIFEKEIFYKNIQKLEVSWENSPIPNETQDYKSHYLEYERGISNDSFKIKATFFDDLENQKIMLNAGSAINFFAEDEDNLLKSERTLKFDLDRVLTEKSVRNSHLRNPRNSFLELSLVEPSFGFGYDIYNQVYNKYVSKISEKNGLNENLNPPKDPIAPKIKNLKIGYNSQFSIYLNPTHFSKNSKSTHTQIYHVLPFGLEKIFKNGTSSTQSILTNFNFEGALYIGLSGEKLPEHLTFLFNLKESKSINITQEQEVKWEYLANNNWQEVHDNNLFDETNALTFTGRVKIKIPKEINKQNSILNPNYFWFRVVSLKNTDFSSQLISIHLNGIKLVSKNSDNLPEDWEKLRVLSSAQTIPSIESIEQVGAYFGHQERERQMDFYERVSKRIRHKNRAITSQDIQDILLEKFKHIHWIQTVTYAKSYAEQPILKIILFKDASKNKGHSQLIFSTKELKEIEDYLNSFIDPFVRVEVCNPTFEHIRVSMKVKSTEESYQNLLDDINKALNAYINPWIIDPNQKPELNKVINQNRLLGYLNNLPSIQFITEFSLLHILRKAKKSFLIADTATQINETIVEIKPSTPSSILIFEPITDLERIDNEKTLIPKPYNLSKAKIGQNFFIVSDATPEKNPLRPRIQLINN